jgi:hypothetical protein
LIEKISTFIKNKTFVVLLTLAVIVLAGFIVAVVIASNEVGAVSKKNSAAYQNYTAISAKMKIENEKALEKALLMNFTKQQLTSIVQNDTKYTLIINGKEYDKKSTTVFSESPDIYILLFENFGENIRDIMPKNVIEIGSRLSLKSAQTLIKIRTTKATVKTSLSDLGSSKMLTYKFKNVKTAEIITLQVDPIITEKLGLDNSLIEIIYNKAK